MPKKADCEFLFRELVLPIEDEHSNEHLIKSADGRIKDGKIYSHGFILEHDYHEAIHGDVWVTFHRNTALKSVSVEGVD